MYGGSGILGRYYERANPYQPRTEIPHRPNFVSPLFAQESLRRRECESGRVGRDFRRDPNLPASQIRFASILAENRVGSDTIVTPTRRIGGEITGIGSI
jgi:hypothetical protein